MVQPSKRKLFAGGKGGGGEGACMTCTNLELGHVVVTLLVVGGVDDDLVEDLVETRDVRDLALDDSARHVVEHPHVLGHLVRRPDLEKKKRKNKTKKKRKRPPSETSFFFN